MDYILDETGEPVACSDSLQWAHWFESANRTVARTEVGSLEVSTVFLGMDHRFSGDGPPVLWETMVFGDEDERMRRYSSRADAEAGHAEVVAELRTERPHDRP